MKVLGGAFSPGVEVDTFGAVGSLHLSVTYGPFDKVTPLSTIVDASVSVLCLAYDAEDRRYAMSAGQARALAALLREAADKAERLRPASFNEVAAMVSSCER